MNDLLQQAIWSELNQTLERWINLNELAAKNAYVSKNELDYLRRKITDLEARLDAITSKAVA